MAETNRSNTPSRSGGQRRPLRRSNSGGGSKRPHFSNDPGVRSKMRELDDGEPMSIAERISSEEIKPITNEERANLKEEDIVNVTELQRMKVSELVSQADKEGVVDAGTLTKRDLIFNILKQRVKSKGIMCGEGTLQILPDGFGFLRSPEYQYMSCPDDIYVSPSQIRKFNLRNGSVVSGQIRPPKENERYFALLRVEKVNGADPDKNAQRILFDVLTALHPDSRIMMEHDPTEISTRVVDMMAPIGFGQRGLIVSPPRAGKTMLLQNMARAVIHNYPEAYVIMLLIDERPEEVTDMEPVKSSVLRLTNLRRVTFK